MGKLEKKIVNSKRHAQTNINLIERFFDLRYCRIYP